MRSTLPLLILVALAACSESRESDGDVSYVDDTDAAPSTDADNEGAVETWRIDVFPPVGTRIGERELLPHTFSTTAGGTPLDLVLATGVRVEGTAAGYRVGPLATSALPGAAEPIDGTLSVRLADSVQGRTVALDADGEFGFDVVPGLGYQLVVTPRDASLPLYIEDVDLTGDLALDLDVGTGSTLWGRVLDDNGAPMSGVDVRAVSALGPVTAPVTTREDGTWLVRVPPGAWTVEALGRGNGRDPKIVSDPVLVDADGAGVDLQYPNLETWLVGGRMVPASGAGVRDGVARFTALSLDGYDDSASLIVEVPADDFGNFDTRLVPGLWHVQLFPQDDQELTPVDLGEIRVAGPVDLGETALPVAANVSGEILDPEGAPVPSALLECVEEEYGRRTWTLRSDDLGNYVGPLPKIPMRCDLVPPGDRPDLAQTPFVLRGDEGALDLTFVTGIRVDGQAQYDDGGTLRPLELGLVEVRDAKGQLLGTALTRTGNGTFSLRVVPAE